jgi:Flp pilus assembly protein TadD
MPEPRRDQRASRADRAALVLLLLLAAGCATHEAAAPEPAPPEAAAEVPTDPARAARAQESAQLVGQAQLLAAQGKPFRAIAVLEQASLLDSENPEPHLALGALYLETRRPKLAAESFEQVVELRPDDARAYAGLGTAYHRMGRAEEAKAPLQRATEAFPNDYSLWLQLGRVSFATEDYALCAHSFRTFTNAVEKRDASLLPEMWKQDYQRALSFAELCESKAR